MVKVNIRLDTRHRLKNGTYPLKIAISRQSDTLYIKLNINLHKEDWDADKQTISSKNISNRTILNSYIRQRKVDVEQRLLRLQADGSLRSYTDKSLLAYLQKEDETERPHYIKDTYQEFIALKDKASTRRIYERTIALVGEYSDCNSLVFEDVNVKWLNGFKVFLTQYCRSKNGMSIHFRNLRALFNFAITQGTITCYPFRMFKIEGQATEKRSMGIKQLRDFLNLEVQPFQQPYKDTFILTFLLIGINIADLSQLMEIKDDRIEYIRMKTGKVYNIKVEPEALQIIDKYRGTEHLLSWFDNRKVYNSYANRCNIELGKIGKNIDIDNLTLYWARHTWATIAYELDIPDDTISRALGHSQTSGANVTQIYIRTNSRKIDAANRKVIDFVFNSNFPV